MLMYKGLIDNFIIIYSLVKEMPRNQNAGFNREKLHPRQVQLVHRKEKHSKLT